MAFDFDVNSSSHCDTHDVQSANGVWLLRSQMCEFLSFSLQYPDVELARALTSGEWSAAAMELVEAQSLALTQEQLDDIRLAVGEDGRARDFCGGDDALHVLRAEATRLFIGSPDPLVSPYEGIWRLKEEGVEGFLFINPHARAVKSFAKECGLGRPAGTNEPLDYIATEFELLEQLAARAAGIASSDCESDEQKQLPGGSAGNAYGIFLRDHVSVWGCGFASQAASLSSLSFYRATAALIEAFLNQAL